MTHVLSYGVVDIHNEIKRQFKVKALYRWIIEHAKDFPSISTILNNDLEIVSL